MKSTTGAVVAFLSLPWFCAAPVAADVYIPKTDQAFQSSTTTYYGAGILQDLETVGQCEAASQSRKTAAFILTTPGSAEEETAYRALFGHNVACLGLFTRLSVPRYQLRGALAEGLYKLPPKKQPIAPASVPAPAASPFAIDQIAECYTRANPDTVRAFLLSTTAETRQEQTAFAGFAGDLGPCIPAGVQIKLNADRVRLALAEAAYRVMVEMPPNGAKAAGAR
jgi:hypothetical protein